MTKKSSNSYKQTWQGRQDLNLQHPILETGALPIELRPCKQNKTHTITVQLYHIVLIIVIEYKQLECKEYKKFEIRPSFLRGTYVYYILDSTS